MSTFNNYKFSTTGSFNGTSSVVTGLGAFSDENSLRIEGRVASGNESIDAVELIQVANIMKQMIIDISQDEEIASKYPYIKEAAHVWFIQALKGP
jgi:hypothetical protein